MVKSKKLKQITKIVVPILKKKGVKKAGIFGSYARGEAKRNSDIDILIQPRKGMGFGFFGLAIELEEKLGKKVDLVSYNGIRKELREQILKDEVKII